MLIKCTKCGFENQMGAIFCRGCGEKIDMDSMDPDTVAKNQNKKGAKILKAIRKFLGIVILLGLIGVIASAFVTFGLSSYEGAPASARKDADAKFDRLSEEKLNYILTTTDFTMDEVNSLLNTRIFRRGKAAAQPEVKPEAKPEAPAAAEAGKAAPAAAEPVTETPNKSKKDEIIKNLKKTFKIQNVMVAAAGKNMTVVVYAKAFGYVPLRFEFTGMLQLADEKSALNFYTERGKIGYLPMPGNVYDRFVLKKFAPAFRYLDLERILKRATVIRMSDDKLQFGFEKQAEAKK